MKKIYFIVCVFFTTLIFSQQDSLKVIDSLVIDKKYLEDQLYLTVSYNVLSSQPTGVNDSGFSYGISLGFIKDVPLNEKRNLGLGFGLGYGFDSFNQGLRVTENNNQLTFEVDNTLTSNKLVTHSIEFPIEIRWRNSTANRYTFWRVYTGVKFTYNFANKFEYVSNSNVFTASNIANFNKWQAGFIFSAGYDAFNLHFYYGLSPILNDSFFGAEKIDTRIMKFGLTFYIL